MARKKVPPHRVGGFRWYVRNRYHIMEGFLDEFDTPPTDRDVPALRSRYLRAVRHGRRVYLMRFTVTILLAFGLVTTVAVTALRAVPLPGWADAGTPLVLLERAAALAGSITLLLVALRLAFDRYVDHADVNIHFLAMLLAGSESRRERPPG